MQSKINFKPVKEIKKILDSSSGVIKKLNKTSIMNFIDNFNSHTQPSATIIKKSNINTKRNNKIKNDFNMNFITPLEQNYIKTVGNNTSRLSLNKIFNLKRNINNNNSNKLNSVYSNLKNNIKNLALSKINILNKPNINQNKINKTNKIIQTTRNNIKKFNKIVNFNETSLNKLNNIDNNNNNEKCYTSRINVKLKNKKNKKGNFNRNVFNNKLNNISGSSLLNNIIENQNKTTTFISQKNNMNENSLSKFGIETIGKENNYLYNKQKRNINEESSLVVYRKKSPLQIRDLSDSPKQKYLNEKTRKKSIPWKIKRKGIDDKLDSINIFDRYIKKFKLNKNLLNTKHYLKQNVVNNQRIKINNNKLFNKKDKNILNPKLYKKNELNINSKNYNNSCSITENTLITPIKLNNLKSLQKKYFININDNIEGSHKDKKKSKNIKFRNLNIPIKTAEKINTKYNNESYLTLNNYTNNNKFGKLFFENQVEGRNINIFINEYKL